jgi:hypothetical protein
MLETAVVKAFSFATAMRSAPSLVWHSDQMRPS